MKGRGDEGWDSRKQECDGGAAGERPPAGGVMGSRHEDGGAVAARDTAPSSSDGERDERPEARGGEVEGDERWRVMERLHARGGDGETELNRAGGDVMHVSLWPTCRSVPEHGDDLHPNPLLLLGPPSARRVLCQLQPHLNYNS